MVVTAREELFLPTFDVNEDLTVTDNSREIALYRPGQRHITFLCFPIAVVRQVTRVDNSGLWGYVVESHWHLTIGE